MRAVTFRLTLYPRPDLRFYRQGTVLSINEKDISEPINDLGKYCWNYAEGLGLANRDPQHTTSKIPTSHAFQLEVFYMMILPCGHII
jgi:hypothetical protein